MLGSTTRRAWLGLTLIAALSGGSAATASAHVQVSPTLAAPNDAVEFTVLVPGERAPHRTTKVVLKVPAGVLPYSFEATPGWRRQLFEAKNGAVDRIAWSGRLAPDGFAEFSFLAATPGKPGELDWKALQVYEDGEVVRWIGPPGSEEPAPVTEVRAGAPLQNAGGEGASGTATAASEPAASEAEPAADDDGGAAGEEGGGSDGVTTAIAVAALALAAAALTLAIRGRRGNLS